MNTVMPISVHRRDDKKISESLQISNICDYYAVSQKEPQKYDLVLILDAEIISSTECISAILSSEKMIVMGDIENPELELLFTDGFENTDTLQKISVSKQKSILSQVLQKGAGFRTLLFQGYTNIQHYFILSTKTFIKIRFSNSLYLINPILKD